MPSNALCDSFSLSFTYPSIPPFFLPSLPPSIHHIFASPKGGSIHPPPPFAIFIFFCFAICLAHKLFPILHESHHHFCRRGTAASFAKTFKLFNEEQVADTPESCFNLHHCI